VASARDPILMLSDGLASVVEQLRALAASKPEDWVDQVRSPLGSRMHCRLVREGELKGSKVARRVLVRRRDLDAFIESHGVAVEAHGDVSDERAEVIAALQKTLRRPSRRRRP